MPRPLHPAAVIQIMMRTPVHRPNVPASYRRTKPVPNTTGDRTGGTKDVGHRQAALGTRAGVFLMDTTDLPKQEGTRWAWSGNTVGGCS